MREVKTCWTEIMNNPDERTADRLKASELLARAAGAFLHIAQGMDIEPPIFATGEVSGEDVIIYMPQPLKEEDCEAAEEEADL